MMLRFWGHYFDQTLTWLLALFGNILKKGDSFYSNPKSKHEHFVLW